KNFLMIGKIFSVCIEIVTFSSIFKYFLVVQSRCFFQTSFQPAGYDRMSGWKGKREKGNGTRQRGKGKGRGAKGKNEQRAAEDMKKEWKKRGGCGEQRERDSPYLPGWRLEAKKC